MLVECIREYVDSKRGIGKVRPGDKNEIDPLEPAAMYYRWPAGTKVYHKVRGTLTTPAKETTRIIPGKPEEPEAAGKPEEPAESHACDICGKEGFKSPRAVKAHQITCKKKNGSE